MTTYNHFLPHQLGATLRGTAIPSRGIAAAYHLYEIEGQAYVATLTWTHVAPAGKDEALSAFLIHLDGQLVQTVQEQTLAAIGPLRPDVPYVVDVHPVSLPELAFLVESLGQYIVIDRGSRIQLTAAKATAYTSDFHSYGIYYDAGDEDAVLDTLLEAVRGLNHNETATPALDEKTYTFGLKYKDTLGNESASFGSSLAVAVRPVPLAVDSPSVSYNATTRQATITGAAPAGQVENVTGYEFYTNWLPGYGLMDRVVENSWARRGWTDNITTGFTTGPLWAGTHRFMVKAITNKGVESDATELVLTLAGSPPVEIADKPDPPFYIDAIPLVGGDIQVTVRHLDPTVDSIKLYRDTVYQQAGAPDANGEKIFTESGLVSGTSYSFTATAVEGAAESEASEAAVAVSDDQPPTGPQTLTGELIH